MFCPLYYSGLTNGAIIGANYNVNRQWHSLWDGLIERPTLCRIAGDPCILLTLITSFLPHSASLYFLLPTHAQGVQSEQVGSCRALNNCGYLCKYNQYLIVPLSTDSLAPASSLHLPL